jgi:hypothetical protein
MVTIDTDDMIIPAIVVSGFAPVKILIPTPATRPRVSR